MTSYFFVFPGDPDCKTSTNQLKRTSITYKTSNEANHFIWTICFRMLPPTHSHHHDYDIQNHDVPEPRWDYGLQLIEKNLLRKKAVRRWNLGDLRNHTAWWVLLNLVVKANQLHFWKKKTSHILPCRMLDAPKQNATSFSVSVNQHISLGSELWKVTGFHPKDSICIYIYIYLIFWATRIDQMNHIFSYTSLLSNIAGSSGWSIVKSNTSNINLGKAFFKPVQLR